MNTTAPIHKDQMVVVVGEVLEGRHGPFVIAFPEDSDMTKKLGSITVNLSSPVWEDTSIPDPGDKLLVWDLKQKRKGWRAQGAKIVRLEDVI